MDKNYKIVTANDCHQCKILFTEMPILQLLFLSPVAAFLQATACVCSTSLM